MSDIITILSLCANVYFIGKALFSAKYLDNIIIDEITRANEQLKRDNDLIIAQNERLKTQLWQLDNEVYNFYHKQN